jgi:DNA-binding transcriptional MerR regulator
VTARGLRSGELAERAGVNVQTLRYYERRGLLAAPGRRPSGQREYPQDAVALLRAIKAAQRLGFTLAEIDELLAISQHRRGSAELHRRAQAKIAEIDARIDHLTRMRQALETVLAADCDSLTTAPAASPPASRASGPIMPLMLGSPKLRPLEPS